MVQRLLNDVYVVDEARQLALRERGYGPPPVTSAAGGRSRGLRRGKTVETRREGEGACGPQSPWGLLLLSTCSTVPSPFWSSFSTHRNGLSGCLALLYTFPRKTPLSADPQNDIIYD